MSIGYMGDGVALATQNIKGLPYLAVGDNSTDDYAAIQAAIDAGATTGVTIPGDSYAIGSTLRISAPRTVDGVPIRLQSVADVTGSCLRRTGTGTLLNIQPTSGTGVGVWVRGLHLRGEGTTTVVTVTDYNKVTFQDCIFNGGTGANNTCVHLTRTAYITFINCRFENCLKGVTTSVTDGASAYCNAVRFINCEFSPESVNGVGLEIAGVGVLVQGSTFEGGGYGLRVSAHTSSVASYGVAIIGNYFEAIRTQSMDLGLSGGLRGMDARGNYFSMSQGTPTRYVGMYGIGMVFEGNSFFGIVGDPNTNQINIENSDRVRIQNNSGLATNRVTQTNNTNVTLTV